MVLLKSGWIWRQSSVLKRWKMNWCDLWIDGTMVFYQTDSRRDYETRFNVKCSCLDVRNGREVGGVCPPEGHPRDNLLLVYLRNSSTVIMSANSGDEALAWKLTIEEARGTPVVAYNPNDDGYQAVPLSCSNAHCILGSAPPGTHVYIQKDPYDYEQLAVNVLVGCAAGLALRSFFYGPFLFCC